MRLIGTLPNEQVAQRFADHLLTMGINIMVEESAGGWTVWVESDDHLEKARAELDEYARQADDPRYRSTEASAARLRAREEEKQNRLRKNYVDVRTSWARPAVGARPVTFGLIALCCVVAVASLSLQSNLAAKERFYRVISPLLISQWPEGLPEIRSGQAWRLITPIFIHFNIWHLLFNMLWLYQLGSIIEVRKGSLFLLLLVLVSAIISNFLEYLWPIATFNDLFRFWRLEPNPYGGGMSGVVYALFGYVWLKGRFQPHEGLAATQNDTFIMLAWLALCFTGLMGHIGNTAHLIGLIVGMFFGAAPYYWRKLRR